MFALKDTKQSLMGLVFDSFRLVNRTWAVNIVTVLIYYILHVVIAYFFDHHKLFMYEHITQFFTFTQSGTSAAGVSSSVDANAMDTVAMQIIGVFLSFWLSLVFRAILAKSCWNMATTGSAKVGNAFAVGIKYFYVYFFVMVIYTAVGAALFYIVRLFNMVGLDWLTAIVAILCACIFYYVLIKLVLVEVVAVIDDCGLKAIGRSWSLVSNGWWRTLGTLVFSSVFYTIMLFLVGIGIYLAVASPGVFGQLEASQMVSGSANQQPYWFALLWRLDVLLTFICIFFTLPSLYAGAQVVLTNDLKRRSGETS